MVSTNPLLIKDFKVHYCNATEPLWGGRLLVLQSVGNYGTPFIYPPKMKVLVDHVTLLIELTVLSNNFILESLQGV